MAEAGTKNETDSGAQVIIRPYHSGDEIRISEVYEKCYSKYSGYQSRTPDFWKWFNLLRPGVGRKNILVATVNGRISGCLALCPNGAIIDPCYDPEDDGRVIMGTLIRAAEEAALKRGIEKITISSTLDDVEMKEACKDGGMKVGRSGRILSLGGVNHGVLMSQLLTAGSRIPGRGDPPQGRFCVEVSRVGGIRQGLAGKKSFYLQIQGDKIHISEGGRCDVRIVIENRVLASIVFGKKMDPWDWVSRRIRVHPPWRFALAYRFLNSLNLDLDFYFPRGGVF